MSPRRCGLLQAEPLCRLDHMLHLVLGAIGAFVGLMAGTETSTTGTRIAR